MSYKPKLISVPALVVALLLGSQVASAAEPERITERSITVSASGSVTADPDIAYMAAGVVSDAETAREALAKNAAAMTKLLDGLKALGIAPGDIQTTQLNVDPRYTNAKDNPRTQVLSGYRVTNQVYLVIRDLKRLGEIVDQAISLGANHLGLVSFEVSKADQLKDEARKAAVANARRRAELFAAAAGVQLGTVVRIFEEPSESRQPPVGVQRAISGTVPLEPGSRTLSTEVQVTWTLR